MARLTIDHRLVLVGSRDLALAPVAGTVPSSYGAL
jgi:hypothetical protein